jgi:hypothetical protein
MDFDRFAPGHTPADDGEEPTLRILSGGRLVFNAAAQRRLGGVDFVQLFWDADTAKIGVLPSAERDPDSFAVITAVEQSIVTSQAFVDEFALPLSIRMRLAWDGSMWIASTTSPDDPLGD